MDFQKIGKNSNSNLTSSLLQTDSKGGNKYTNNTKQEKNNFNNFNSFNKIISNNNNIKNIKEIKLNKNKNLEDNPALIIKKDALYYTELSKKLEETEKDE